MSTLRDKAISAFNWGVLEGLFGQGFTLVFGILLARILSPSDFGIIGISTAILNIANSIVDAGLGSSLMRNKNASSVDYSTVFYTNILLSILIYIIVYIAAPIIADFFHFPDLVDMIRVIMSVIIINSLSLVQRVILSVKLDFKSQALVTFISSLMSGLIALIFAYNNFGIWSLAILFVSKQMITTILFWFVNKWKPLWCFSVKSFKENFDFGYKLLLTNLINTVYKNVYSFVIGKFFSPATLGYYNRAESFQQPLSSNIAMGIRRMSFPILSKIQDNQIELKQKFQHFIKYSFFLSLIVLTFLAAVAKPMILLLMGEKWSPSIIYTQLLCIPGVLYPLQILNLNLLSVKGYSNLNLRLEVIKKIIVIPILFITIRYGVIVLIYSLVAFSIVEFFINSFYTNRILNYSLRDQLSDIAPFAAISIVIFVLVFPISYLDIGEFTILIIQSIIFFILHFFVIKWVKIKEFEVIYNYLIARLRKIK